jgi:anti-sigma B factor antagonist
VAAEDASLPAMSSGSDAGFLFYVDATTALSVTVRQFEHAVVMIHVAGELDMLTGPPLKAHLDRLLSARPERLIIDLGQVAFLGSTGLAVLVDARHTACQQGTRLQLSGINHRPVTRPLQITGLDRVFEISPSATGLP